LFCGFLYVAFRFWQNEKLYSNAKICNAYIYKVNDGIKSSKIVVKYYFYNNNIRYYGGINSDLDLGVKNKIIHKYLPVLYDSLNPKSNVLLVDINRWKRLDIGFPDSLKWLLKYYP